MTTTNTISWDSVRAELLADQAVKAEYGALETEFDVAHHVVAHHVIPLMSNFLYPE